MPVDGQPIVHLNLGPFTIPDQLAMSGAIKDTSWLEISRFHAVDLDFG